MSAEAVIQHFRGVLCCRCGKPVRVPGTILRKDTESRGTHEADDMDFHLISQVFVLRCRSCEKEWVYAINQIIDCAFPLPSTEGFKHAAP